MSQQSKRQASVRAVSGTTLNYEGDWHAMWDAQGIAAGPFNGRMLSYINTKLGTSYTNVNNAMQALATANSATNFSSLGTFDASLYEAEAVTLFAAMSGQPTSARKTVINTLIKSLKTASIWTDLDLLYVHAAHDVQAAKLNWVSPATFVPVTVAGGPTFVADRGFTSNAVDTALDTQWTPSTHAVKYTLNDASAWVFVRAGASDTNALGNAGTHRCTLGPRVGTALAGRINDGTLDSRVIASPDGFSGVQRTGASVKSLWRDGAKQGADFTTASTGLAGASQYICGVAGVAFTASQLCLTAWGASLAGKEAAFNTAVTAYMGSVGAV